MMRYQTMSSTQMLRFARRSRRVPRCLSCGQHFHLVFRDGRLAEQRCGCGLVYRVEAMGIEQVIEEGVRRRPRQWQALMQPL
jgi:hypothetical protein